MIGLSQIVHELSMLQIPHKQRERFLHLVTAHHYFTILAHEQTLQVSILAYFEQKHVIFAATDRGGICVGWLGLVAGYVGEALARLGHFHQNHREPIASQQHHMIRIVQLEKRKARIHRTVKVIYVIASIQIDEMQIAFEQHYGRVLVYQTQVLGRLVEVDGSYGLEQRRLAGVYFPHFEPIVRLFGQRHERVRVDEHHLGKVDALLIGVDL